MFRSLIIIFLSVSLFASEYATLKRIVDGDTFVLQNSKRGVFKCRLYGIDTPEKFGGKKLNKDARKAFVSKNIVHKAGLKATKWSSSVLEIGKRYPLITYGKGYYGRTLCDLKIDNGLYSVETVKNGYAVVYKNGRYIKDRGLKRRLLIAEKEAEMKGTGLWNNKLYRRVLKAMKKN